MSEPQGTWKLVCTTISKFMYFSVLKLKFLGPNSAKINTLSSPIRVKSFAYKSSSYFCPIIHVFFIPFSYVSRHANIYSWCLSFFLGSARVKFGVKMDVIGYINLLLFFLNHSIYLKKLHHNLLRNLKNPSIYIEPDSGKRHLFYTI